MEPKTVRHPSSWLPIPLALLMLVFTVACNLPRGEARLDPNLPPPVNETPLADDVYAQCAWFWATQSLPELSNQIQADMDLAGLNDLTVRAEAYGENCILADGSLGRFAVMETDFRIQVQVPDLDDQAHLGDLLERILVVLDNYPPGVVPGSNAGYIGVTFLNDTGQQNLWFTVYEGEAARALGLHGADLFLEISER